MFHKHNIRHWNQFKKVENIGYCLEYVCKRTMWNGEPLKFSADLTIQNYDVHYSVFMWFK